MCTAEEEQQFYLSKVTGSCLGDTFLVCTQSRIQGRKLQGGNLSLAPFVTGCTSPSCILFLACQIVFLHVIAVTVYLSRTHRDTVNSHLQLRLDSESEIFLFNLKAWKISLLKTKNRTDWSVWRLYIATTCKQFQTQWWNMKSSSADLKELSACYQYVSAYHLSAPTFLSK